MTDDLGDRMKGYERMGVPERFMPRLPLMARIDGRAFSSFTRGMDRPFDARLSQMMIDTTLELVRETGAVTGYCQSDEITLCFFSSKGWDSQIYFDGKVAKVISHLAATASVFFYRLVVERLPPLYADRRPSFDCRAWNVPTKDEAVNAFLWRENDAVKNSVSMAARSVFSHAQLQDKRSAEMREMLFEKGVNWNDYPAFFKRGTYVQRRTVKRRLTPAELANLPEKHDARQSPDLEFERSACTVVDMPPLSKVANRVEAIFDGASPVTYADLEAANGGPPCE